MARSNHLTDEEILEQWYPVHNFKGGTKFCSEARKFLALAGQWPWEWCDHDLNPRQWRSALVHDLARLAETYKFSGKNFDEAKLPLRRAMRRRKTTDKQNQFLDYRDVNKVINEFKPQQSSSSDGMMEGEHKRLKHVNKTRHEPTAVAKPTTSKPNSQAASSRGSRMPTELPDRSTSRARIATSTNSVEPNRAEPRLFMGSPMPMPERALSVMRLMSEMPSLPEAFEAPDLSTPRARMATSTNSVETELGPFVSSPMSEEEPEPEIPLPTMPEPELVPGITDMPVTVHIPTTTHLPEITHVLEQEPVLETSRLPETTDRPETTHMAEPEPVPQTMGIPETTDLPETMDMPEIIGMFDTMDMPESMNMSDSLDMPDTMYMPDITGLPETMYLPEIAGLPQTTDLPETTDLADTMLESTDMPEPESVPGTMVMPEADPAAKEAPAIEDAFPTEPESRDSKRGIFWDHVFESQSLAARNKKRPSSSPTPPPKKRARGTLLEATCRAPDGIYDAIAGMRDYEITLQKRVVARNQERAAFQDSRTSYIEQQALSSLESKIRFLRRSIQTLERDREPIKERVKELEKLRSVMRLPDTANMRGLDEVNRKLQENSTAISNAEKTLQQTIEALDRQKVAGEKLAASVEENYNEAAKQLLAWHTLMKLVHGFPSSMDKANAVLKMQDASLEKMAFFDEKQEEDDEDDSGIDEPLIKTPELPDLSDWGPLDGSTKLAKAPLHNDI